MLAIGKHVHSAKCLGSALVRPLPSNLNSHQLYEHQHQHYRSARRGFQTTPPRHQHQHNPQRLPLRFWLQLVPEIARLILRSHFRPKPKPANYSAPLSLPSLDTKWQQKWEELRLTSRQRVGHVEHVEHVDDPQAQTSSAKKIYILPMFPYPSGDLHLGHLRVYTISDVLARFRRMQGHDVLHPIGWDAFGLPAENAAIERGIDPATWTKANIKRMKGQVQAMNGHWDWDREFATCDPAFYKHTQRLFLLLHERGLAYQAESLVNYDPVDKTVLANEQVDANGNSWRSGAKVEQRLLKQWFLKISEFRQELLDDLKHLAKDDAWPERVLLMQKNWIGKSQGARIKFPVIAYNQQAHSDIEVFTTRPDTVFGVQYIALASTHPIVQALANSDVELQAFLDTMPALPADSKVGYMLPHVRATNPLAYEQNTPDATKTSLPIYVAPYVLGDYGDGAVMGVPGHDVRDHAFWKHNRYDEPVRMVISPSPDGSTIAKENQPFVHHGHLTHHSGPYAGQTTAKATRKILAFLESKGLGSRAETWRLRDWLVSRQRYWGTPIPIIHCNNCGAVPVPVEQLPVELPVVDSHWAKSKAGNPLEEAHEWVNVPCPKCGGAAKRDTDTMDTFVDSSWYFMRFPDSENPIMPFSPAAADTSLPIDIYIGGVEHAILHLLYARFISKFIATTDLWPTGSMSLGEPFKKVLAQGMVHGKTYSDPDTGRFLKPGEVDLKEPLRPIVISSGKVPKITFEKMSKSKYNGVDPGTCMKKYGADATRAHILFQAPVSEVLEWDEEKISGVLRWLRRVHDHIDRWNAVWLNAEKYPIPNLLFLPQNFKFNPKLYLLRSFEMYGQIMQVTGPDASKSFRHIHSGKLPPGDTFQQEVARGSLQEIAKIVMAEDKKLWREVQKTIVAVNESYSSTYSLNTVVSDLMSLTNTIIDNSNMTIKRGSLQQTLRDQCVPLLSLELNHEATIALVKMMAPIAPAFAEECWSILNPPPTMWDKLFGPRVPGGSQSEQKPQSIFDQPFPESDNTYEMLAPEKQLCSVQVDGRLRCVVELPVPPQELNGGELEKWMVEELLQTEEVKAKLMGSRKGSIDIRKAKRVIVARAGKTVSFVM
ncbi:hypothetical protein G7Y89_g5410 [Cudoniella acicularis]|uniref:leucine--tRNA ligase n=1 Tax=Cudoniella acicularis TaxID=354080 RepID=A0A8H4W5R1_9HELO|nr:hypothetical protein G7Y89_g5410 [Cudoniella acicularis]